jgi:transcriptional regulator with XRE-family HTH domain
VPRKLSKPRPRQGARLAALRRATGLTQAELAEHVGEVQPNIAYWEQSDKPPRSDVLPKLAKVLGVSVEDLLSADVLPEPKHGPVGRMQKLFAEVSRLPRRQQDKVVEFVEAFVSQYRRKAS